MVDEQSARHWATTQTLAVRSAVAESLNDLAPGEVIIVACSGGPDSLALAAASAFVGQQRGLTVVGIIVDHQLQMGSAEVAEAASSICIALGLDPVVIAQVEVTGDGGPEAAARSARHEALDAMAVRYQAKAILLGHTREDQAETVLLRLARGSGTRSISAMQPVAGLLRRPLLGLERSVVHASASDVCRVLGVDPWQDPHNGDAKFARVRVRAAMATLEEALGAGFIAGLARTAELAGEDASALEQWSDVSFETLVTFEDRELWAEADQLALLPRAIRSRIIRRMCLDLGAASDAISLAHVQAVDALITQWHGQGAVSLPARVNARRDYGRLILTASVSPTTAGDPLAT
ncbi:MAG: tRNA lysidine(34) synthetase TilS [Actinobacteria bacterium]|uniref:tRNA(Ile)-lysidine synthetase n=1 Tax=freshwater metagenome TaxID=449393 RepID=A0A6J7F712_9ZZZZ|nr:tRNA lysidine(34) synthetase TilS [Actinomycetota bacterium]